MEAQRFSIPSKVTISSRDIDGCQAAIKVFTSSPQTTFFLGSVFMRSHPINRRCKRLALASRGRGFSLVELVVVISVIVILLSVIGPAFIKSSLKARQSAREVVQANLSRARAHAIATGKATAVLFFQYGSGEEGGKAIGVAEVQLEPASPTLPNMGYAATSLMQRWDVLPGNMMFLTSAAVSSPNVSVMEDDKILSPTVAGRGTRASYIVFGSSGQIVYPANKPIEILLGPARLANGNVELLERNNSQPSFERLQVNRLTGKARQRPAQLT